MPLHDKEVTKESHAAHSDADDASNEEAVKVPQLVDIARSRDKSKISPISQLRK